MLTFALYGRAQALVAYVEAQTGEFFGEFMLNIFNLPMVIERMAAMHPPDMSSEELALLAIAADLTHEQVDILCKKGRLLGTKAKSSSTLTAGLKVVEKTLPSMYRLKEGFSGVCFKAGEYVHRALDVDYDKLESSADASLYIFVMRAGDGSADCKYPMFNEAINFVQDPDCQCTSRCHVVALARLAESVASEIVHLSIFHEGWDDIPPWMHTKAS